jgi:hypothetical protein
MKTTRIAILVASGALLAAACSSPRYIVRGNAPPVAMPALVAVPPGTGSSGSSTTDETATRAWFAHQLAGSASPVAPASEPMPENGAPDPAATQPPATQPPASQPTQQGLRPRAASGTSATNEDATRAFLQQEIEYQRTHNPARQPEPIYQTVDRPVYGAGYDAYGQPVYVSHCNDGWSDVAQFGLGIGLGLLFGHYGHCHW